MRRSQSWVVSCSISRRIVSTSAIESAGFGEPPPRAGATRSASSNMSAAQAGIVGSSENLPDVTRPRSYTCRLARQRRGVLVPSNDLPLSRRWPPAPALSRDGLPAVGSNGLLGAPGGYGTNASATIFCSGYPPSRPARSPRAPFHQRPRTQRHRVPHPAQGALSLTSRGGAASLRAWACGPSPRTARRRRRTTASRTRRAPPPLPTAPSPGP